MKADGYVLIFLMLDNNYWHYLLPWFELPFIYLFIFFMEKFISFFRNNILVHMYHNTKNKGKTMFVDLNDDAGKDGNNIIDNECDMVQKGSGDATQNLEKH